jgi:sugar-phosphatase
MICANDITRGKPDPEGYLSAAAQLGRAPEDCVVIEDAPAGIEAAHAAGMRVIAIASTHAPDRLTTADAVVAQITDLDVGGKGDDIQIEVLRAAASPAAAPSTSRR